MARVNVEQKALTDPRFDLLGQLLGSNRFEALGRMLLVWHECQERGGYILPEKVVNIIMGNPKGAEWLVESDLAERVEDGVRIRGTEGRVEWLEARRSQARKNGGAGGRPKNQRGTKNEPTLVPEITKNEPTLGSSGFPPETPLTPAPALAPPPASSAAAAEVGRPAEAEVKIDPLRESERNRKDFEAAWNSSGLKPVKRLTHTLRSRLDALMLNADWRECWREALAIAGKNPFLAAGLNRRNGPLDPSEFLANDDFADSLIRGKFTQYSGTGPPPEPTVYTDPDNLPTNKTAPPMRPRGNAA